MKKISKVLSVFLAIVMVLAVFPIGAFALDAELETAQELTLNESFEVFASENNGEKWFKFTALENGDYSFYSFNNDFDTVGYVYDALGGYVKEDDDGGDDSNFRLIIEIEAGQTFYFKSRPFSEQDSGRYTVIITKLAKAESFRLHCVDEIVIYEGSNVHAYSQFFPENCAPESIVSAESSNEEVAFAYPEGDNAFITAFNTGKATITATTENGLSDTLNVNVAKPIEFSLDKTEKFNLDGTALNVCYSFTPVKDAAYKITVDDLESGCYSFTDVWNKENEQIVYNSGWDYSMTVDMKAGEEYRIYSKKNEHLSFNPVELSIKIEEAVLPTSIILKAPEEEIYINQEFEIEYEVEPANATALDFTWEFSDTEIIQHQSNNRFYALNIGTTTVTATSVNGISASVEIEVSPYESIYEDTTKIASLGNGILEKRYTFTPKETGDYCIRLDANKSFSNYYAIEDSQNNTIEKSWESDKELFVSLNKDEVYTIIILSYEEVQATVELTINKLKAPETFEIISDIKSEYYVGDYIWLETALTPEGCSKVVNWTSSNEDVAYCYGDGSVSVNGVGTAIITGTTSNGLTDSVEIVVIDTPTIKLNQKYEHEASEGETVYKFVADESGYYAFNIEDASYCWIYVYEEDGKYIGSFPGSFKGYFEAGIDYEIKISCSSAYSFVVSETVGVKSIEIFTLPKRMVYIEGFEEYEYYGLTAKVVFEDDSEVIYEYSDEGTAGGYIVDIYAVYDENDNYARTVVSIGEASDSFEFTIKENTVESIEYIGKKLELIENSEGYFTTNVFGEEVFFYYIDELYENVSVKINFTDKESIIVDRNTNVDGYYLDFYADQHSTPWVLGNENYITIYFLDKQIEVPVEIVETPVRKIVVNQAPTKIYYENDYFSGQLFDRFEPYFDDLTGLSFTVYFKDGTSKTYTDKDIDEDGYIDGSYLYIMYFYEDAPFGNLEMEARYMGVEFSYNVVYKEFPYKVKDIKVVTLPKMTEYEYGYFPNFEGMVVEITYEDGQTKRVELTKDNMIYEQGRSHYGQILLLVDVDGLAMLIDMDYFSDDIKNSPFRVSYGGAVCNIEDIKYVPLAKEIESVEASGTKDIVITVNFTDGSKEDYALEGAISLDGVWLIPTSKGYVICYAWGWHDEENNKIVYDIEIFDEYITYEIDLLKGDINGDKSVDAADLALLKKVIAKLTPIDNADVVNPDVDGEGDFPDAADLAMLKKIIAKLI